MGSSEAAAARRLTGVKDPAGRQKQRTAPRDARSLSENYRQEMGLYGNLIVPPPDPDYWPLANREIIPLRGASFGE
jgi:hypothetical protein